jgi:CrcB protein
MNLVLVFVGGGLGAVARYLCGVGFVRAFGPSQPYIATALINVLGGFLMGVLVSWMALRGAPTGGERWRLLLGVGVLGGFTTFSSFSLEAVTMIQRKAYGVASVYVGGSVVLSILGLMLGLVLMRRLLS